MPRRGKYICIEGPDGSGKTTLCKNLAPVLDEVLGEVHLKAFPSKGRVGTFIRQVLCGEIELSSVKSMLHLFVADAVDQNAEIESILERGENIICDRHPLISGRVFQPEHHRNTVVEQIFGAINVVMPDYLFVFLNMTPEMSLARVAGREKYKDVVYEKDDKAYLLRLCERYAHLQKCAVREGYAKNSFSLDVMNNEKEVVRQAFAMVTS